KVGKVNVGIRLTGLLDEQFQVVAVPPRGDGQVLDDGVAADRLEVHVEHDVVAAIEELIDHSGPGGDARVDADFAEAAVQLSLVPGADIVVDVLAAAFADTARNDAGKLPLIGGGIEEEAGASRIAVGGETLNCPQAGSPHDIVRVRAAVEVVGQFRARVSG